MRTHPQTRPVLGPDDIRRSLARIAFQIIEKNKGVDEVVLMGIRTRGQVLAERIAQNIAKHATPVPTGSIDISGFRDDRTNADRDLGLTEIPEGGLDNKRVILVDDVLYTGRTVRAALDVISELGRPQSVQLAVLVDRGHRELPIRADYVGKNLPTARDEQVLIHVEDLDTLEGVFITGGDR
ncbi:bifunctional pyr operon transcriptional regulator/uracil phosphoribosyltransferase [Boudabousia liubingyangii]|uniref:Bifunctional protein PyrR n=1 Tax=Boudabousia liubingyangii TaxID=1921764 RepID=A0A1Q5PNH6_9ACTO|nr:bifunctional pyr operon transcriptional regulator/uracil phosphoribosyltransferase PyrR [Boudabousia liubingyangii]OKL47682.1 bifunctional pyr operon transcriptional regulator/uracil phosphoribosyltransferase [Boudabousia liubingyangii]OKL49108.1 bifunctional pyr operon transcriptional regulator/uracil phosphoribosyltransferase [Boudabousia liubingyangii]